MSAEQALDAYEAARHRLPPIAPVSTAPRHAETLAEIADGFDLILLDAFGVLNIGETVIPGVPERVAALQAAGKRVMVVSNAASVPTEALLAKYARLGYAFDPQDVVTSRATMARCMTAPRDMAWGVAAPAAAELGDLDLPNAVLLARDAAAYAAADGFLLIGTGEWTAAHQTLLEAALADRPRPVLVANPDIVAPRETGFSIEPGQVAHRLADLCGVQPEFYGKPYGNIYDLVFERAAPVDKARTLMVGDSLHTDILGARACGIASALIGGYGFFAGRDPAPAIARTGIVPDFILSRP